MNIVILKNNKQLNKKETGSCRATVDSTWRSKSSLAFKPGCAGFELIRKWILYDNIKS